jgi:hypothetical protein
MNHQLHPTPTCERNRQPAPLCLQALRGHDG